MSIKQKNKITNMSKKIEGTVARISAAEATLQSEPGNRAAKHSLRSLKKNLSKQISSLKILEAGPVRISGRHSAKEILMEDIGFASLEHLKETFGEVKEFIHYSSYIKSSEWASRRKTFFECHKHVCRSCGSKERTIHLHHRTYARLGAELDDDLIPMCLHCHANLHFIQKTFRLAVEAATAVWFTTLNVSLAKTSHDVRRRLREHTSEQFISVLSDRDTPTACICETIGRLHKVKKAPNKTPIDFDKAKAVYVRSINTGSANRYDKMIDSWIKKASKC